MHQPDRDAALLWDMREAARDTLEFIRGLKFAQFAADKKARAAVERQIITMGEAARLVSHELKQSHPEIPWRDIIGTRNVLVHEYSEVKIEIIWLLATRRIPELVQLLDPLIPPPP
jgi:uncharacterized protein with HEPN domain